MSEYNIQMNKYNALSDDYDQLYPKPMKHASTHAKDGSDPILPSSIGAYSKEETDTLLANKAPSGYGWGDASQYTFATNEEFKAWFMQNAAPKCSRNTFAASVHITDQHNARMLLIASGNDGTSYITIMAYAYDGYEMRCSVDGNGNWKPWEYVNPPMLLGVEYRTTERYMGKPVYTKTINFGALPNNDRKNVSIGASIEVALSCNLSFGKSGTYTYSAPFYGGKDIGGISVTAHITGSYVCCVTTTDYSDFTAVALCKYTKTTD